jgi:ubiquinone/menaquinone biosynthesis C-methylase UbiE
MRRQTLDLLRCPTCRSPLAFGNEGGDETVDEGNLYCSQCERSYPIKDGVTHFIEPEELEGPNRRLASFYDWLSSFYDLFFKMTLLSFGGDRKARKEILDRLDFRGGRILEVSIGTGANLPYVFETPDVGEVYGLDISPGEVARCRSRAAKRGWQVDLFIGTAEALPFKAECFDSVFHIGGINFFSGKKEAIDEMIRVARPGSKIVIADESERLARFLSRIPGFSPSRKGEKVDVAVPLDLVPDTMEETRLDGIWKAHGQYHGYCLEFRKPV